MKYTIDNDKEIRKILHAEMLYGVRSYSDLDDITKDKLALRCLFLYEDDPLCFLMDSLDPIMGCLTAFIQREEKSDAMDLARIMKDSVMDKTADLLSDFYEREYAYITAELKRENGYTKITDDQTGEVRWIK